MQVSAIVPIARSVRLRVHPVHGLCEKHTVLDYSDDCEVLEIILPAEFKTVELE
jgi:hypothetical protein